MKRIFKTVLIFLWVFGGDLPVQAYPSAFKRVYGIAGYGADIRSMEIKKGPSKEIITVGGFTGTVDFDPGAATYNLTSSVFQDAFISKTDSNFNLVWAYRLGNATIDEFKRVEIDTSGNIYVCGSYQGTYGEYTNFDLKGGTYPVLNVVNDVFARNGFIAKYDADANLLWVKNLHIAGVADIFLRPNGSVVATGQFVNDTLQVDGQSIIAQGSTDMFVLELNPSGNLNWLKHIQSSTITPQFNTTPEALGGAISVDGNGNIFVAGGFNNSFDFDPGPANNSITSNGSYDIFILKLNSIGQFEWVQTIGGSDQDVAKSLVIDANNEVYISGNFFGTLDFDAGPGIHQITSGYNTNNANLNPGIFVMKLSGSGSLGFASAFGRPSTSIPMWGFIDLSQIDLDASGYIYAVGRIEGIIDFDPGVGQFVVNGPSNLGSLTDEYSSYILRLSNIGNLDWVKIIGSAGAGAQITSIEVDEAFNVFTSGRFRGTVDFNTEAGIYPLSPHPQLNAFGLFLHQIGECYTTAIDTHQVFGPFTWIDNITYNAPNYSATTILVNAQGCDSIVNLHLDILPLPALSCNTPINSSHQGKGYGWLNANCSSFTNGQEKMYSFTPQVSGVYYLNILSASGNPLNWFYHDQSYGTNNTNWTCLGRSGVPNTFSFGTLNAGVTYYILADAEGTILSEQDIMITADPALVPVVSPVSPGCGQHAATFSVINNPGSSVQWYDAPVGGNLLSVSNDFTTPIESSSQNYWVQAQNACAQASARTLVTHVVNPLPEVTASVSNAKVCKNTLITLSGGGASNYSWSPGASNNIAFPITSTTTFTLTGTDANNCTNTTTIEIEVYDLPGIGIAQVQDTVCLGDAIMLSGTGGSFYTWSGGIFDQVPFIPATTTTYTVTGTGDYGCTNTATKTVFVKNCNLNLKYYLQGYYAGNSQMYPILYQQGQEPMPSFRVDTVTIELRKHFSPYDLVETQTGILQTDGTLRVHFQADPNDPYHLVFKHRNHIETWSAESNHFLLVNTIINFSSNIGKVFGDNQTEVESGIYAFYSGDINQDGVVDGLDYNEWENDSNNFVGGYFSTDLNGDGIVDGLDFIYWEINSNNFVGAVVP